MVAKTAGVSSATVSRVYNAPHLVRKNRREAVLQAASKLGYIPNKSASALRRNGTGIITLVEIAKGKRPYYWNDMAAFNWFYGEVIKSAKKTIDSTMYHLTLETITDLRDLNSLQHQCDGILFFDIDDQNEVEAIQHLSIPYVAAHHTYEYTQLWRCSTDNVYGGRLQADALARKNVKRPVYITSYIESVNPHAERLQGFLDYWSSHEHHKAKVIELESDTHTFDSMIKLVSQTISDGADGIACVNDVLLLRVLNVLLKDQSLKELPLPTVGYDAIPFRDVIPYKFASIDIKQAVIYQQAAELLLKRLSTTFSQNERSHHVIIEPALVPD